MTTPPPFKAAVIQLRASEDLDADIGNALGLMRRAVQQGARLLTLPEICVGLDQRQTRPKTVPRRESEHPALPALRRFAAEHAVEVLVGSLGIVEGDKIRNRSYLLDSHGAIAARYDKLHLFDIDLGGDIWFRESDTFAAGERAVLAPCMGARAGLAICYDLRFPQLFRRYAQAGAQLLFVPAAFTRPTGRAHWHSLLRARAIENGAWVIAPAQHGDPHGGCYGHSLIVDPWGEIRAECGEAEEIAVVEVDLALVEQTRAKIPSLKLDVDAPLDSI